MVFVLALITTLFLLILSNLANDYGDFVKGTDNKNRVGPERTLQSGLITKDEMVKEFIDYYGKNIVVKSKLVTGVYEFLKWAKSKNISMGVCTNKQEHLAVNLLKKIKIYDFFEYVAGRNTFEYCKPDPRHITSMIEIMNGSIVKSLMIGDSENDADAAKSAGIPMILLEEGYTDRKIDQIYHDHLIKDFNGIEKIIINYLND